MDARQNFYNHNRLLFRFLVGATVIFVGIITLLWWQEQHRPISESHPETRLRHFSTEAAMAQVTRNYEYGTRYINDMESYPELAAVLLDPALPTVLGGNTLDERLAEVAVASTLGTSFDREHVYQTSYYIGNVLVLPGLTLHGLLLNEPLPETARLLETALADLRAGVLKMQRHYDVAPPSWYMSTSSVTQFYPTPSFPSLPVSETSLVLYLLAQLDPDNARSYEQSAKVFASQAFVTGSYFRIDIEYAIKLVEAYVRVIQRDPAYQELISLAAREWKEVVIENGSTGSGSPVYNFIFPEFPVPSQFAISMETTDTSLQLTDEELMGRLRFSLIDTRLPSPVLRLYEYDVAGHKSVLPFALDLNARQFPQLDTSLGYAGYLTADEYIFLSGSTVSQGLSQYQFRPRKLMWRRPGSGLVEVIPKAGSVVESPVVNGAGTNVLVTTQSSQGNRVELIDLRQATPSETQVIAAGYSPSFVDQDNIAYVRDGLVYLKNLSSGQESILTGVPTLSSGGKVSFDRVQGRLLVNDIATSVKAFVPKATVSLYTLDKGSGGYMARSQRSVSLTDAVVRTVVASPKGKYLAILINEGGGDQSPKVLIYDIKSGIIKKEIDLSSFAPTTIHLDGWTLF